MRVIIRGGEINLFSTVQTINQYFINTSLEWLFLALKLIRFSLLPLQKNELLTLNFKSRINLFVVVVDQSEAAYMS